MNSFFDKYFFNVDSCIVEKFYLSLFLFFYIIGFFFPGAFLFKIAPLVFGFVSYFLYIVARFYFFEKEILWPLVWLLLFSSQAAVYLFIEFGFSSIFKMEMFFFFSLPLIFLSIYRLVLVGGILFFYRYLLFFLSFQLFLLVGQAAKMATGFGFQVPAYYSSGMAASYFSMLSGSFMNANDLASVAVLSTIAFFILKFYEKTNTLVGIVIAFFIIVLTASRTSIFLFFCIVFMFGFRLSFKKGVFYVLVSISLFSVLYLYMHLNAGGNDFIDRIYIRIGTFVKIIQEGFSADNSISLRIGSYTNFIKNIPELGLGTVSFRDYHEFTADLGRRYRLFSVNPHSFFVEIGYWLGWSGLFFFISFFASFFISGKNRIDAVFVFVSFIVVSMISSSNINNFILFMVLFFLLNIIRYRRCHAYHFSSSSAS